jgi:hypothetical protein
MQRDTQFYEALKRFGDQSSVTVRLSAAVLIGELAATRRTYITTAVEQLIGGIQVESDLIVLRAIVNTLRAMAEKSGPLIVSKVYEANLELEEALVVRLATYLQALRRQNNEPKLTNNTIAERFWTEAIVVTRFPMAQLEFWIEGHEKTYFRTLLSTARRLEIINPKEVHNYLVVAEGALDLAAKRIRLNDSLFVYVFLGMFGRSDNRERDRQQMDGAVEAFLLQRAARSGLAEVPRHWQDLRRGRVTLLKNHLDT